MHANGGFDVEAFRHAVDIMITAQEILVDNSGYPTEAIARNSHDYRPLGLGYANLGALLMASGLPYDSDAGRDYAAAITAIMCGEAYLQSAPHGGSLRAHRTGGRLLRRTENVDQPPAAEPAPAPASTRIANRFSTSFACTARR